MKKKILCPLCKGRLFDADSSMMLELRPIGREAEIQNALYVKCPKCGNVCAVTSRGSGKRLQTGDPVPADQNCTVVPIKAVLSETPVPLEIKLNIVYSVQS